VILPLTGAAPLKLYVKHLISTSGYRDSALNRCSSLEAHQKDRRRIGYGKVILPLTGAAPLKLDAYMLPDGEKR